MYKWIFKGIRMTTYTMVGAGVKFHEDTSISYRDISFRLVVEDDVDTFKYAILNTYPGEPSYPDVALNIESFYHFEVAGHDINLSNAYFEVGETVWQGSTTYDLTIDPGTFSSDETLMFTIGGPELPEFASYSAALTFLANSVSYSNLVRSGLFLPNVDIDLTSLAGISVTENDKIVGSGKADKISGGIGSDKIFGQSGSDMLFGGSGNDRVSGRKGNDEIFGGSGKDLIDGGKGNDNLSGNRGADRFVFRNGDGVDTVLDFKNNQDTLRLDDGLWSDDLSVAQVLEQFASKESWGILLDFGDDRIKIEGINFVNALADDITIF
jgi:hypothetical protein